MIYGSPYGAGYGDPANTIKILSMTAVRGNTGIAVQITPATNWGNVYWQIYRNAKLWSVLKCAEGQTSPTVSVPTDPGAQSNSILALRVGPLSDPYFDCSNVARTYESATATTVTIDFQWTPECLGSADGGNYTSAWSLTGVLWTATRPAITPTTWSLLDYDLAYAGGNVTVTLRNGNSGTLASGTGAVGGSITLAAQNNSGISGSVTVASGVNGSGTVVFRWPATMNIQRGTVNPPTNNVAQIPFNHNDFYSWTDPAQLAAGTYYYRIVPVTDTGETGPASTVSTEVVPGPPQPPSNLAYKSGNAAATVLSFVSAPTPGATYRLYVQNITDAYLNFNQTPTVASAGATQITCPAFTGYPGTAYVILRAVNGSTEEQNCIMLALEYDASGNFVPLRPNTPDLVPLSATFSNGRTLSIRGTYNTTGQLAAATSLQLFTRTPSGTYNFASPAATVSLGAAVAGVQSGTATYTFGADGFYYVTFKSVTAGGTQSASNSPELLVYASAETTFSNANPYNVIVARG